MDLRDGLYGIGDEGGWGSGDGDDWVGGGMVLEGLDERWDGLIGWEGKGGW